MNQLQKQIEHGHSSVKFFVAKNKSTQGKKDLHETQKTWECSAKLKQKRQKRCIAKLRDDVSRDNRWPCT